MLSFIFNDIDGAQLFFPAPLYVRIRMDEDVPADDLYAVFPTVDCAELKSVRVYDGEKAVFIGVVDEEERRYSESGGTLHIAARTLAAHLLDNESVPRLYDHPSASLIYENHVKPYEIRYDTADDAACFAELNVTKGMSEWTVLKSFCLSCYSSVPRISADGALYMKGAQRQAHHVFSDSGEGVRYTSLKETTKRCQEISRVRVKTANTDGYTLNVDNADALERGIRRERYLNALLASTPMTCADTMIQNGAAASYSLTLSCPSRQLCSPGDTAAVKNAVTGEIQDLYVSALRYTQDQNGEKTQITLKRRIR